MKSPGIVYRSRADATLETELSTLVNVYKFILFSSQTGRGGSHDLTINSTVEMTENGPRKPEQEHT